MTPTTHPVAVITGGGSGLGRALALTCAARGMHLVLADVDRAGLDESVRQLGVESPGCEVLTQIVDVSKLDRVESLAAASYERFGRVDWLFNNAGVGVNGPIWENSERDWTWVLGVNLLGVAWGIKAFVPRMLIQGHGHLINTASAAGWVNAPGSGVYNASKCAVVAMSESLAMDFAQVGASIGVSVLSPAFFPTGIVDSARNRPADLACDTPMSDARRRSEEQLRYAVEHGRLSAAQVAEITVQAVENRQFYIFPHGKIKAMVLARAGAANAETEVYDSRPK
jgi:NAD(P)-dependent dehydrogenase (short-subunit alcohol dehydrogenase family)